MTEGGLFVRVADRLANADFTVLRFSFRGHGGSGGTQRGTTIAGELLDLQAVVEYVTDWIPAPLSIVASSFGAEADDTVAALRQSLKQMMRDQSV